MNPAISHAWGEETLEAKARWFQSLTVEERMDIFVEFTELAFALNPHSADKNRAQPVTGHIQVLQKA
ncbi:MAG: hypothetical protein ABIF71_12920 [Planctomycetota bacterium]